MKQTEGFVNFKNYVVYLKVQTEFKILSAFKVHVEQRTMSSIMIKIYFDTKIILIFNPVEIFTVSIAMFHFWTSLFHCLYVNSTLMPLA